MQIAIAGFGLEGRANLEYFRAKFPEADFTIFDERESLTDVPSGVQTVLGEEAFGQIRNFDLVLRSPSIPPRKIGQQEKHWSATREFFAECARRGVKIIGVTGSKGKGTVASFVSEILKQRYKKEISSPQKRKIHLVGNIGTPALEILPEIQPNDFIVYELSSFQLWDLGMSPQIAVMTLIEPDHLDVHENMAEYVEAKSRIFQFQKAGDLAIYNADDALVREIAEAATSKTGAIQRPFPDEKFAYVKESKFYFGDEEICPTSAVNLPGEHNLLNALAAIDAVWDLIGSDIDAVEKGLSIFHGLPHRLQFVREIGDVKFYDDSIATTPGSVIAALKSFDEPKILILGGRDKGADYSEMAREINMRNVRMIFAIGENRDKIATAIRENSDVVVHELDLKNMSEIVKEVWQNTAPGDVVILSPAASSFDMFKDYKDRGEQFTAAVKSLN